MSDALEKGLAASLWNLRINPLPHMLILGSSISAANKDMMSKYCQIGIQFSVWVENIVGKEEIARYEQFLLFPYNVFKSCLLLR